MPERRCASHKSLARCSLAARAWPRWIMPRSQRGELHRGKVRAVMVGRATCARKTTTPRSCQGAERIKRRSHAPWSSTPLPCVLELDMEHSDVQRPVVLKSVWRQTVFAVPLHYPARKNQLACASPCPSSLMLIITLQLLISASQLLVAMQHAAGVQHANGLT